MKALWPSIHGHKVIFKGGKGKYKYGVSLFASQDKVSGLLDASIKADSTSQAIKSSKTKLQSMYPDATLTYDTNSVLRE